MTLVKMLIQSYEDSTFSTKGAGKYTVFLNPESFTHTFEVAYDKTETLGQSVGLTQRQLEARALTLLRTHPLTASLHDALD